MKRVYLAEDLHLNRNCALAQMIDSFMNDTQRLAAVSAFEREADLLAKLENIHIPHIYDRFSENQTHYLVMEYVPGRTLEERLADEGRLDEAFVVDVADQILDALAYLHGLKPPVVYRDMKPSNVIVRGGEVQNTIKLVDFGIARHFKSNEKVTIIGTPGYAPPEQYAGKPEPRSDLYALGATLHQLLTGHDPTSGEPFIFPLVLTLRPTCNPILASLIDAALSYPVEKRPTSALDFKQRLSGLAATQLAPAPTAAMVVNRVAGDTSEPTVPLPNYRSPSVGYVQWRGDVGNVRAVVKPGSVSGKYRQLHAYLMGVREDEVTMTFNEIERVLGDTLPPSAYNHRAWWGNEDPYKTVQRGKRAWLLAGFKAYPDLPLRRVTFQR